MRGNGRRTKQDNFISDAEVKPRGREQLIRFHGLTASSKVRSPLTAQLISTINHNDAYVSIPLHGTRTKGNMIYNMRDKAKRAGADLHWTLAEDGKTMYAWFTKKKVRSTPDANTDPNPPTV